MRTLRPVVGDIPDTQGVHGNRQCFRPWPAASPSTGPLERCHNPSTPHTLKSLVPGQNVCYTRPPFSNGAVTSAFTFNSGRGKNALPGSHQLPDGAILRAIDLRGTPGFRGPYARAPSYVTTRTLRTAPLAAAASRNSITWPLAPCKSPSRSSARDVAIADSFCRSAMRSDGRGERDPAKVVATPATLRGPRGCFESLRLVRGRLLRHGTSLFHPRRFPDKFTRRRKLPP